MGDKKIKVTNNIPSIVGILSKEFPYSDYGRDILLPVDNIYYRRCDAIYEKLKEHDLHLNVFNHTFFEEEYYVIQSKDDEYVNRDDIINALDIPNDWIDLVSSRYLWTYFIKQKEFNEKYCNADGEIDFNTGVDNWNIKNKSVFDIDLRLMEYGLHSKVTMDFQDGSYVCIIKPLLCCMPLEIAEALNLSVDDVEVLHMGNFMVRL